MQQCWEIIFCEFEPFELQQLRLVSRQWRTNVDKTPMWKALLRWTQQREDREALASVRDELRHKLETARQNGWDGFEEYYARLEQYIPIAALGDKIQVSEDNGWVGFLHHFKSQMLFITAINYNTLRIMSGLGGLAYST